MSTRAGRPPSGARAGDTPAEETKQSALDLSLSQVLGGALAAVTSALAASYLGVAGTLIGAFVGSLIATVGAALYRESLARAGQRLRVVRPGGAPEAAAASAQRPSVAMLPGSSADADALVFVSRRRPVPRRWLRLTVGLVSALGIALATITAIELVIGHPVSGATRTGTTIGDAVSGTSGDDRSDAAPAGSAATATSSVRSTSTARATATSTASASAPVEEPEPTATSQQFGATREPQVAPQTATGAPRPTSAPTEPAP